MDMNKIGAFITERRKAINLTQKELADKLCVTDRAVSKWECGKGFPDISLMTPLCEILGIALNEFLRGETIEKQDTTERAEKLIFDLLRERQESKKKILLSAIIGVVGLCVIFASIILSAYVLTDLVARILTISFGAVVMIVCLAVTIVIDREAGCYECPKCKKTFVPDMKSYVNSVHTLSKRKLTCPHCGQRSWCRHKLSK